MILCSWSWSCTRASTLGVRNFPHRQRGTGDHVVRRSSYLTQFLQLTEIRDYEDESRCQVATAIHSFEASNSSHPTVDESLNKFKSAAATAQPSRTVERTAWKSDIGELAKSSIENWLSQSTKSKSCTNYFRKCNDLTHSN